MRPYLILKSIQCALLAASSIFSQFATAGYWENQFHFPPLTASVPENTRLPEYSEQGIHLLSVFELMTDLGRQQAREIERLVQEEDAIAGCFSMDRINEKWPTQYIEDFRNQKGVALPFYFIDPPSLRGLFRGYDSSRLRIFPHTLLIDDSSAVHRILVGVQSKEDLSAAIKRAKEPWASIESGGWQSAHNLIRNGDFESTAAGGAPGDWGAYQAEKGTMIHSPGTGWRDSGSLEIRSSGEMEYQIAYQIIPHQALLGQRVRLHALAQSNSLGDPQIALAVPHPRLDQTNRFVPRAPIKTRSGQGIPLRIIGELDFESDHAQWQQLQSEITIPGDARALVLAIYLDNPKATGGAARFDELVVEKE